MDFLMHMDCVISWVLFTMDAQQKDLLMHMDTLDSCCYCLLWMPQQMNLLLHTDIVNTTVIVICYYCYYCKICITGNIGNTGML